MRLIDKSPVDLKIALVLVFTFKPPPLLPIHDHSNKQINEQSTYLTPV